MFLTDPAEITEYLEKYFIVDGGFTIQDSIVYVDSIEVNSLARQELTHLAIAFGNVIQNCNFEGCKLLSTLQGAPHFVGGNFTCASNPQLRSLVGGPSWIGGSFFCQSCEQLTTLEGSPPRLGGDFNCANCKNLKSLKHAPIPLFGNFYLNNNPRLDYSDMPAIPKLYGINLPKPTAEGMRQLLRHKTELQVTPLDPKSLSWRALVTNYHKTNDVIEAAIAFELLYGEPYIEMPRESELSNSLPEKLVF